MNVLQLCHRVPFPANDGGNIAMLSLADSILANGASLKMLALNTKKHDVRLDALSSETSRRYGIEAVSIDTALRVGDAFRNLFSSASYNIQRFYSPDFEKKLTSVVKSSPCDVVLMESLFMTPYIAAIRKISSAKIVLRAHNVEHIIWQRLAANEKNPLRRAYLSFLARRLRNYELEAINKVDAILPITTDDEKLFRSLGCAVPMHVAPVGIDAPPDAPVDTGQELCLFHLGAMDWRPNVEGIQWFLDACWKNIHAEFPSLKLFLAGRGFPQWLVERKDANVKCEGEIMDAGEFMRGKQLMIVPLKSGGGMRVKIIQGMALGKTIISTTIGAEGIQYTNGKNILIADSPAEMLAQVGQCMRDRNLCFSIGEEGRKLVRENYSNAGIGKKVLEFFKAVQ
jgi:polysaccharide biosynthesis protein PslH